MDNKITICDQPPYTSISVAIKNGPQFKPIWTVHVINTDIDLINKSLLFAISLAGAQYYIVNYSSLKEIV